MSPLIRVAALVGLGWLVTRRAPLRVGDRVRVVGHSACWDGKTGTITHSSEGLYIIQFTEHSIGGFAAKHLEAI